MKIWRFSFAFAFVLERQINSPRVSFAFVFVMVMLGTRKLQQQATLTNKNKIPDMFFRFRFCNSTERKSKNQGFLLFSLVSVSVRMAIPESGYERVQKIFWTQGTKHLLYWCKIGLHLYKIGFGRCKRLLGDLCSLSLSRNHFHQFPIFDPLSQAARFTSMSGKFSTYERSVRCMGRFWTHTLKN